MWHTTLKMKCGNTTTSLADSFYTEKCCKYNFLYSNLAHLSEIYFLVSIQFILLYKQLRWAWIIANLFRTVRNKIFLSGYKRFNKLQNTVILNGCMNRTSWVSSFVRPNKISSWFIGNIQKTKGPIVQLSIIHICCNNWGSRQKVRGRSNKNCNLLNINKPTSYRIQSRKLTRAVMHESQEQMGKKTGSLPLSGWFIGENRCNSQRWDTGMGGCDKPED